ncbi:MAG: signal peptidase I [Lachnospiraceae bacterium]|nr:signal peptidase I [Lachnospiraceae bacterium]
MKRCGSNTVNKGSGRNSRIRHLAGMMKDAVAAIIVTASILVIAGCLYMNVKERMIGDMAFAFGYKPVFIESGSMEPVIHTGAVILLKKADYSEVKTGDVITFVTGRGYVTHRLVGVDEAALREGRSACLITKGDANSVIDPERLDPEMIRGKVAVIFNPL